MKYLLPNFSIHCAVRASRQRSSGFTLIEISMVLLVIAIIAGAVTSGQGVLRHATHTRMVNEFVGGWTLAYNNLVAKVGRAPADDPANPTGRVNGNTTELCNNPPSYDLNNAFLAHGIQLPVGRAQGAEDRYAYQDSRGLPQELKVCFQSMNWSETGTSQGTFVPRARNVMVLSNVTPELANTMDKQIDGRVDARFGRVRESSQAASVSNNTAEWSARENDSAPEAQSPRLTVYIQMSF